jgi:uncharacterized protein with HEPN domain
MLALCRECLAEFESVSEESFLGKRLFQTSLAWYLQAIGEAASRISDESRALIPGVPWKQIVGTRHILSHEYDRLLPTKLWRILRLHLPTLLTELQQGINRLPPTLP